MEPPITHTHIDGLKIAHYVIGSGTPLVLLHGWGASSRLLWALAEPLAAKGYRVYALDLPGFGESDPPPSTWSVHNYADFVLAYLNANQLTDPIHLFGHSFGGRLGIVLGAHHPNRLNKIVLCDAAGVKPNVPLHKQLPATLYKRVKDRISDNSLLGKWMNRARQRYVKQFGSTDYQNAGDLKETFIAVISEDLLPFASQITCPTLLLWGENDEDTPLWQAQALEAAIPDAGLVVFAGAGHYSYLDALPDTVRVMDYFFTHDE